MIVLPKFALDIIKTLQSGGFEAYAVGGCVRDAIIGKPSSDFDITTSALPEQIQNIFSHSVRTGGKFYTVTIIQDRGKAEVTTFRSEGEYSDSRRPDSVTPASSLIDDLVRRDFTINSICFDGEKIVDLLDGKKDIEKKIIRCIGNPFERFEEDALRIMRAFRFSSVLGYDIDIATYNAAISLADNLKYISTERIRDELIKTILSDNPQNLSPLLKCGALDFFGIEYSHQLELLKQIRKDELTRLSAFLYYCGGASKANLKLSNSQESFIKSVSELLDYFPALSKPAIKYAMNKFSAECFETAYQIARITSGISSDYFALYSEIIKNNEPYRISDLAINGSDLLTLGIRDSEIGLTLNRLLNHVIENPQDNTRDILLSLI